MRLGILTSTDLRHRYFANRLRERFRVAAVVYETTGYAHDAVDDTDLSPFERQIVASHFAERRRQEKRHFASLAEFATAGSGLVVGHLPPGRLNTGDTVRLLESQGVDTVAVFGTNLIKPPVLDRWAGRLVNLHLGLSPYYRGTATNFYPLLNEEPEYVGATVHLLDAGIDSGPILRHARPQITAEDQPHTIGCKAILAGIDAMVRVLDEMATGRCAPVPQWPVPRPRLYLRRDYHPRQVVALYQKLEAGLIPRYVERVRAQPPSIRLVE